MALSYSVGLAKVLHVAEEQRRLRGDSRELVPLHSAVGGIAAENVVSPRSIPEHDTSAMDGYAIRSQATAKASPDTPVVFKVQGTIAAGDDPREALGQQPTNPDTDAVEIMTGAIFPDGYDACVKLETAVLVGGGPGEQGRHILVTKPVEPHANRRFAASDMLEGDIVIRQGDTVRPSHILPLASLGLDSIPLVRKPRVGVWSTGKEMRNGHGATRDANGPYLTAALREIGAQADFLGVLDDDPTSLHDRVREAAESRKFDLLLTSGAVSKGKFDHVRHVLDQIGAEIIFHGLAIRPGHPVLFALIPGNEGRRTAFFGLPGNPGAAAACFRFLTVPYLRALQGQEAEQPILARLLQRPTSPDTDNNARRSCHPMPETDCFRHGILPATPTGQMIVEPSREQSPAKLGPFTTANCWVHFRPGAGAEEVVECYPLDPSTSFFT
ncbi:MoeA, N-terminal and linker domain-containing protein [Achaetomium macrosporum]|uniref:molybdopterin adenylyltransferase n=1 Tax=Achaetomium macrosporum TaxID=79813 RepID=A0AAN7HCB6_9PEZI|nr:MoeA, N-terminal and linker domain-containing protein [Achaetomium macrosporum]